MIEVGKKCKVVTVPDAGGIFGGLLGTTVTAAAAEGMRGLERNSLSSTLEELSMGMLIVDSRLK